jgi:gluconolactonase
MTRILIAALTIVVLGASSLLADETKDTKVKDITLTVPASWKQVEPSNNFRLAQFEIAAVEGDKESAELTIFNFASGGGVKANLDRWIGQFYPTERKAKTTSGKSKLGEYVIVNVSGTFKKPIGPPRLRKTEPMKDARMLGVILAVEGKGNYFLKLTGPNKTVTKTATAFRASFGGKESGEKPFKAE